MSLAVEDRISSKVKALKDASQDLAALTPWEIRISVAELVKAGQMDLAIAACESALALHPTSQDILVISSLVAEVVQDWSKAEQLLVQLIEVQGQQSTAEAWLHLVRVLRCQGRDGDLNIVIDHVLSTYLSDSSVMAEREALLQLKQQISQAKA